MFFTLLYLNVIFPKSAVCLFLRSVVLVKTRNPLISTLIENKANIILLQVGYGVKENTNFNTKVDSTNFSKR